MRRVHYRLGQSFLGRWQRHSAEDLAADSGVKKDDKAVGVAIQLNRLFPDDPEILYQTGKIYGSLAFLNMEKLAQLAPTSAWRHLAAAEAHESQAAYDQAIPEYNELLKLDPQRPSPSS